MVWMGLWELSCSFQGGGYLLEGFFSPFTYSEFFAISRLCYLIDKIFRCDRSVDVPGLVLTVNK